MRIAAAIFALALPGCGGSGPQTGPTAPPPPERDFTPLTEAIETAIDSTPRFDSAALILIQNGHVVYERGFGGLGVDGEVRIASGAKWLTAATVLTAVDRGAIDLDAPISRYLDGFPDGFWEGERGEITPRHLLSLTSGIPISHGCLLAARQTLRECALGILSFGLLARPGTHFVYGQATFHVAGAVVEEATGRSWEEVFRRNLAAPLEMDRTAYDGETNPRLGDGAVSTVREYANFLEMVRARGAFRGRRVLSARLVDEMLREQAGDLPILHTPREPGLGYGLGVWRERVGTGGEPLRVSSPGSRGFWPWIDFDRGLVGVLAAPPHLNRTGPLVGRVLELVDQIVPPGTGR